MSWLRRAVFYVFAALYLVSCSWVLLYAFGYLIRPEDEGGIVRTGAISLATAPPGASIYLGRSRYTERTPAVVRNLTDGEYEVRVALPGHRPWERTLPVRRGAVTVLEHILLLPEQWKTTRLSHGPVQTFVPVADTRFALLAAGSRLDQWSIYDVQTDTERPLVSDASSLARTKVLQTHTMPESSFVALRVRARDGERMFWVDVREPDAAWLDVTKALQHDPERLLWIPDDRDHVFILSNNHRLSRFDRKTRMIRSLFDEPVRGVGVFDRRLYVLTSGRRLVRMAAAEAGQDMLSDDSVVETLLGDEEAFLDIIPVSDKLVLFLSREGRLLCNGLPHVLVEHGVRGVEVSRRRDQALIWTDDRLGVVSLRRAERLEREDVFARGLEVVWVYQNGRQIRQAVPAYQESHVVLRDGRQVQLLELETVGQARERLLLELGRRHPVMYVEEEGRLYFVDPETRRLAWRQLVPQHELTLPFALPDVEALTELERNE